MSQMQIALAIVTPMILGTGVMLWRERALDSKALLSICAVVLGVAVFLFFL